VNWQHFQAFMGLRYRLFVNQLRRGGIANVVILTLLAVLVVLLILVSFVGAFLIGFFLLPEASPAVLMYAWDGLVLVFLFMWAIGVLTELQRSEALTLDKFLHLPVSLSSAFLINYLSSLVNLSMIIFVPITLALTLGLILTEGPAMLLLVPLIAGFFLMVTALTYQFQGWLASLMANKRRRQTIIVMITMSFVLLSQLPNLANILGVWHKLDTPNDAIALHNQQQAEVRDALSKQKITLKEFNEQLEKLKVDYKSRVDERERRILETVEWTTQIVNIAFPPGWLPLGAKYLAVGNVVPALLGTLGFGLIGAVSLRRAYRTTIRYYTGQFTAAKKPASPAPVKAIDHSPAYFLEKKIPWLTEQTTAVALASLRSLLRAPEAKMMLMSPLLMVVIFGSMLLAQQSHMPSEVWPFLPLGALAMTLLGLVQFAGNQFGFDRSGFRVLVLSPARRQDILLGKNLAIAPLCLGCGSILALLSMALFPPQLSHVLALPFEFVTMFLIFCVMANWLSIFSPMAIRAGTFRAAQPKGLLILLNLAFVFLLPMALSPTLLPLGLELLLRSQGILDRVPIRLLLSITECALILLLYRVVLAWQGNLLQTREQKILETVAVKSD
jgi:ABC-2 type transport system permease protein